MDVVYNHVPDARNHPLGICVPGYYFRVDSFSGAGDDTASEREMFRNYMVDSLRHWLSEYKLCGFRFDLMGLHDVETMNAVREAAKKIKPDVLLYGEGWNMYRADKMVPANMNHSRQLPGFGFFNDALRSGIKGSDFNEYNPGFIHSSCHRESVKFGLVGAVYHPQIDTKKIDGTSNPEPWSEHTSASVSYTEIHDNATLNDKLRLVEFDRSEAHYEQLQKMALGLILAAQGMPVLHAGMEFMRTKEVPALLIEENPDLPGIFWTADKKHAFSHNSYNLADIVNGLDWERCAEKQHIVDYARSLIRVRRTHPLFRLQTAEAVLNSLTFIEPDAEKTSETEISPAASCSPASLAWIIANTGVEDAWKAVCIVVNPGEEAFSFILPEQKDSSWHLVTDSAGFFEEGQPEKIPGGSAVQIGIKTFNLYAAF
ncbi:hypothetical protein K7I13_10800 [Brucepastera parasyntrophica]|uniref:hypothetical protein n=1 Tax=Brucepastera parasyntrophica TaxID=2880008 RepID=UPI00210C19F3|nr:hypothetical protein [Brucepastera parasyntrophica]ULQ58999.1 hypothetical protein K7I13_10800 [Brucepastera parasyntrophica]